MDILFTGFEPFGGEKINPSWKAVAMLPDEIAGARIHKLCLPVEYQGAARMAQAEFARISPNVVVMVGQAGGRSGISIERVALNLDDATVADNAGVMLCDSPTAYEKEPETLDYIVRLPTRFDQTLIPAGEIGRYIVTARRAGDRWYLGALTNWDAREVEVKLDFLGDGRWKARIFRDGVNADRYGEDYLLEERTVTAADSLAMPMAPGGGYAVQFERVQ